MTPGSAIRLAYYFCYWLRYPARYGCTFTRTCVVSRFDFRVTKQLWKLPTTSWNSISQEDTASRCKVQWTGYSLVNCRSKDTVNPVLSGHTKRRPNLVFKTDYHLMQVKSIAECSLWSILQYFRPSLSYHLSLRSLFCLFLSGRLRRFYCTRILVFTIWSSVLCMTDLEILLPNEDTVKPVWKLAALKKT